MQDATATASGRKKLDRRTIRYPFTFYFPWTFSMNRSQAARRRPSRAIGPSAVRSIYARAAGSNLGHFGRDPLFGSPVFAKFVQYFCIASDTALSVPSYLGAFADRPAMERVPNT